jgi:glutamate synthase domain-containing protein 2/glutamate synthase domain-containing protein 1/glutamate synthase domain-containing protein 3
MTTERHHNTTRTIQVPDLDHIATHGLYNPANERDACGVGVVANIDGSRNHTIIDQALEVLINLGHRGACGCDPRTGDGAGVLIQMPDAFMRKVAAQAGITLPPAGRYGVGMTFLPNSADLRGKIEAALRDAATSHGLKFLGWRDVPVDPEAIGEMARVAMPAIRQFFVEAPEGVAEDDLERKLYVTRKSAERAVHGLTTGANRKEVVEFFYVCSLSARTIVYKGLIFADQMKEFYRDLADEDMVTAFGMVHSRFSTNTLGSWRLAHPYRMLAHNGEINTVRGNRNWMAARERVLSSPAFGADIKDITPVIESDDPSDTASLDNGFEFLRMGGRSLQHVAAMMLPAAWYGNESMPEDVKAFYEYYGGMMEPWDGPAMITFTDGNSLGAVLDRNGLRPFRYWVTKKGLLVMASEAGVLNIPPEEIEYRDRLAPGRLFLVDFDEKRIVPPDETSAELASMKPYGEWLKANRKTMDDLPEAGVVPGIDLDTLVTRQMAFGYTAEDLKWLIGPMAVQGAQPNGSMGNDAPPAVLSDRPQTLFSYFKQKFAQVSNPPLDPIREKLVTQMAVPLGRRPNLFDETPEHAKVLRIDHPMLFNSDLAKIKVSTADGVKAKTISTLFPVAEGQDGLRNALDRIRAEASQAIDDGYTILILSDRGVDAENSFIPSLLATGAAHHHLIREQTRTQADIIVESGEPREVHHFAALFGYGASAINPYLALESIAGLREQPTAEKQLPPQDKAEHNFRYAIESGVLKTMSKMGISTLQGYIGAQIFEALGLSDAVTDEFFRWTESRIGGIDLEDIATDVLANHSRAYPVENIPANLRLDLGGLYLWRGTGERHMWNPDTIALLQDAAVRNDKGVFKQFETASDNEGEQHITIRNMLELNYGDQPVPLDEVEPAMEIVKRFATGAISLGSISREAHETLAIAMNRIGARSNTGEGGEDPSRYKPDPNGDNRNSAIKQVASGRFGVNTSYLVSASDLQIKMAQGAKPGEGGELPGWKVSDYIAFIRKTTRGVELISPPPHHDIYSIEDLAQLIHDLKNVNPESRVHVKLVAVAGVGIIAAGVAKGKADVVLISGDSGGTGASPLSSIRHGGIPWELGLAETQQVLVENGLRDRIVVQTDGQIKTSRDVAVAALLGADEWGVATAGLITMGCIMLRKCHLNTCSVGVATQDPELRAKFAGTPEAVVNYFMFLANGLREHMAKMGFRTVNEMIGRTDKLRQRRDVKHWKAKKLDLSRVLARPKGLPFDHPYACVAQDHELDKALDHELIRLAEPAIERGEKVSATLEIKNRNRTVGAMLSGRIAKRHGEKGLPDGAINFTMHGSGGQSFGAFAVGGVTFKVVGDANDYFGKGLSGGRLIAVPPEGSSYVPEENIIIGNVALYGSTGGECYVRGRGGERFAVRNSAAHAVIEGIGDHGCEYMTGGRVVVLGTTGRNFGAGMSGGIAYVWDEDRAFEQRFNSELARLFDVEPGSEDEAELKTMIEDHLRYTGSAVAKSVLDDWASSLKKFRKVFPEDYARVLREQAEAAAARPSTNGATSHAVASTEGVGARG